MADASCESYTDEYGTYYQLENPEIDPRILPLACLAPSAEEIQIAEEYCDADYACYGYWYFGSREDCEANFLWQSDDQEAMASLACLLETGCVDGYWDFDTCYTEY